MMKKPILIVVIIFSLAIAATYYPWQQSGEDESVTENELVIGSDDGKPAIKYPVPETPEPGIVQVSEPEQTSVDIPIDVDPVVVEPSQPLPPLGESDDDIATAVKQLVDGQALVGLFSFESFIRHFVVTIDNLPNRKIPQRYVFTQRVPDKFVVIKQELDTALLDSKNFKRYEKFVNLVDRIDTRKLVTVYVKFYPLFQEAYEALGYPDRYFNDRFIQVIDHLLAVPEVEGSINLVRPKVFYQFANPELESLSAGQKILVRIGNNNAQHVKSKLRELHTALTTFSSQ